MASQRALLPIEEALAKILAVAQPLAAEEVAVAAARGRFLAQDAVARVDLPPFDSSAMDGFALRVEDTPGRLRVAATIAAGAPVEAAIEPREAMAIATGAAVPSGADAVVPIERVRELEGEIAIGERPPQGANVRLRGGDARAGEVVVGRGSRLGPPQLGALAAAGCNRISCSCRPRVAIVCTGSELRPAGAELGPGQIYESNGALLAGSAASAGAEVENLGIVPDDRQAHRQALESGLAADVLLTTGGVSVGRHDLVREVAGELGVEEVFWGVAAKPGKPLAFGTRGRTLFFGIPGNPVSTLVLFELFVRPALLALQSAAEPGPLFRRGLLGGELRRNPHRDQLVRATLDHGSGELSPLSGQESHMIVRACAADALVHVPRGEGMLVEGSAVRYIALV